MIKKVMIIIVICAALSCSMGRVVIAQEDNTSKVQGVVETISEDGSYIILNGAKMMVDTDLVDVTAMEVGDEVELLIEKTETGTVVMGYEYL